MKARVLLLAALAAITVSACMHPLPGRRQIVQDGQPGIGYKLVMRKVDPNYLMAVDRTSCQVAPDRYRQVREGQRVLCDWKTSGLFAGSRAGDGGAPAAAPGDRAAQREQVLGRGATRPDVHRRGAGRRPGGQ
jgi:hypothetical protein